MRDHTTYPSTFLTYLYRQLKCGKRNFCCLLQLGLIMVISVILMRAFWFGHTAMVYVFFKSSISVTVSDTNYEPRPGHMRRFSPIGLFSPGIQSEIKEEALITLGDFRWFLPKEKVSLQQSNHLQAPRRGWKGTPLRRFRWKMRHRWVAKSLLSPSTVLVLQFFPILLPSVSVCFGWKDETKPFVRLASVSSPWCYFIR